MESIVLAGGRGIRLRPLTDTLPKPLLPVSGRPFLKFVLDWLAATGVERVCLAVGYKGEHIEAALGDRHRGATLVYSKEQAPLGTGGAILKALGQLRASNVVLANGDTLFRVNLRRMWTYHLESKADVTVAVKRMADVFRFGRVSVGKDGRVVAFQEKGGVGSGLINGGVYILKRRALEERGLGGKFSFESDFLERAVGRIRLMAYRGRGYFVDIGVPDEYRRAQIEMKVH